MRLRGQPWAVLMRTPGRERDLIAGFLASEGVLERPEDLLAVEPCRDPSGRPEPNVWMVSVADSVVLEDGQRRAGYVGSSCGLCGARTLDALDRALPPIVPWSPLAAPLLLEGFVRLRDRQDLFRHTAGAHGAGLLAPDGSLADVAEDVGRHNAVDKVLGARLREGRYPLEDPFILLVSGRLSFEIVQKAALGGVGAVAGVGAPTSLAVEAAERFGIRLSGWVRDGGASAYA